MDNVQDRLTQLFEAMDSRYEAYAKSKGLSYLTRAVLEEIYESGGCTQKQISENTRYPKQTVNLVVRDFLNAGYVTLHEMPENRKNKLIELTDKGRALCAETVEPLLESEARTMDALSLDERCELMRLLERYSTLYCGELSKITTEHS